MHGFKLLDRTERELALRGHIEGDEGISGFRIRHDRRCLGNNHKREPGGDLRAAQRDGRVFDADDLRDRFTESRFKLLGQNRIIRRFISFGGIVHVRLHGGAADIDDAHFTVAFLIQENQRVRFALPGVDDLRPREVGMHGSGDDLFSEVEKRFVARAEHKAERLLEDGERLFVQRGFLGGFPFGRDNVAGVVLDLILFGLRIGRGINRRFRRSVVVGYGQFTGASAEQGEDHEDRQGPYNRFFHTFSLINQNIENVAAESAATWWGCRGSNPRPLRCEHSALTS